MKPEDYIKLEKDKNFKKSYLNATSWWRNVLLIPPILLLFIGLAGILYLSHIDKLISLYIIPYIAIFIVGTIWLKAIKKHIQKKMMTLPEAFRVCLAKPIWEKNGQVYALFVNDTHRHNKHYINNLVAKIPSDSLLEEYTVEKDSRLLHDDQNNVDYYIRRFEAKDIAKRNNDWRQDYLFPVLYIDNKHTFIIKKKDLGS